MIPLIQMTTIDREFAAIYARKSTKQNGVAHEERSVTRQIDEARLFGTTRGWSVEQRHIFADDGIAGSEFSARPDFMRMIAAAARHEFSILIIWEGSRLGREQFETNYWLKQLDLAGVKVFGYGDGRQLTITTPMDKILRSISAFADEQERERARERTHGAMLRKARQGHVTGGRVFGYDNVPVFASGSEKALYKVHKVNDAEAAVVRRIFDMRGDGYGLRTIAKRLNDEGVPCPRPQRQRPAGWTATSLLSILVRDEYRGEVIYNKTRKRNDWGQHKQHSRPESEWLRVPAPERRIVTDEQWRRAQEQGAANRKAFGRAADGRLQGRREGAGDSKYLLPGLARCGTCNGTMHVRSRSHGTRRAHVYGCSSYHERGTKVCANGAVVALADANSAIIDSLETAIMNPAVVARTVELVRERLKASEPTASASRAALLAEAELNEASIKNLVGFIAKGEQSNAVAAELRQLESRQIAIEAQIAACDARLDLQHDDDFEAQLASRIRDWRGVLGGNVPSTRVLLKKLLVGPIVMSALPDKRGYRFDGKIKLDELLPIGGARPRRDSNPCFSLERATSWASGRRGREVRNIRL